MYNVNWTQLVNERVPSALRKPKMRAWLLALLAPVSGLHSRFLNYKTTVEWDISIHPSKRVLEWWLNELYDVDLRRIEIKNYDQIDSLFIFLESENKPVYLPQFVGASNYDFEVCIPCVLMPSAANIKGFLDKYKLATKRYILTWVGACPQLLDEL